MKTQIFSSLAFILALVFITETIQAQPPRMNMDSLRAITNKDHRRMLDLLHIDSIRQGVNGSNPNAPNAANYDEAKANPYPVLPDPLKFNDGSIVKNARQWGKRRLEIVEDFDREIYGRVPKDVPAVSWILTSEQTDTVEGILVKTKKLTGKVDNSSFPSISVNIALTLSTPAGATAKVPVIMEFGFISSGATAPRMAPPPGTAPTGPSWQQQLIEKGWGYAIISPSSIQADFGAGLTSGIIGLANKGEGRKVDDWGALRAWAWGASRALDYFEKDKDVDASKVAIEGHSRYGKAALVTLAYDTRFATAYISSSGEGGAKLHRRNAGELVENVAAPSEYHWMAGNFIKYAGPLQWKDLPVDSHELIALCAPRPVFIGCGDKGDGWVDVNGMFMAAAAAQPVYTLLGKKGMGINTLPPLETTLIDGEIGWRQHRFGHTPAPNWPYFIQFADKYFK